MAGRYKRLTYNGKWLSDLVTDGMIVLGGLALLAWLVSPGK